MTTNALSTWERLYRAGATTIWLLMRCDPLPPSGPVSDAEAEALLAYFCDRRDETKEAA